MADKMHRKYILMHKNTPVVSLKLDTASGSISAVESVLNTVHVPVGIPVNREKIDRAALNEWWRNRAIPASRDGIRYALAELNIAMPQQLLDKCLGLSLSDQYWIRPKESEIEWQNVNFFEDDVNKDVTENIAYSGKETKK